MQNSKDTENYVGADELAKNRFRTDEQAKFWSALIKYQWTKRGDLLIQHCAVHRNKCDKSVDNKTSRFLNSSCFKLLLTEHVYLLAERIIFHSLKGRYAQNTDRQVWLIKLKNMYYHNILKAYIWQDSGNDNVFNFHVANSVTETQARV